jgi:hypothetical protein
VWIFGSNDGHPLIGFDDELEVGNILPPDSQISCLRIHVLRVKGSGFVVRSQENKVKKSYQFKFSKLRTNYSELSCTLFDERSFDIPEKEDISDRSLQGIELF